MHATLYMNKCLMTRHATVFLIFGGRLVRTELSVHRVFFPFGGGLVQTELTLQRTFFLWQCEPYFWWWTRTDRTRLICTFLLTKDQIKQKMHCPRSIAGLEKCILSHRNSKTSRLKRI